MNSVLTNLQRIATALYDIRNPPDWCFDEKDRWDTKRWIASMSVKKAARRARAQLAFHLRNQGMKYHLIGQRLGGISGPAARNWVWIGRRFAEQQMSHHENES